MYSLINIILFSLVSHLALSNPSDKSNPQVANRINDSHPRNTLNEVLAPGDAPVKTRFPAGDGLNVTRCYCLSSNWTSDNLFGAYYHFSYYNFHYDQLYTTDSVCEMADRRDFPGCLTSGSSRKFCAGPEGNRFCYGMYNQWEPTWDVITFNKKSRRLWEYDRMEESSDMVAAECQNLCDEKLVLPEGKTMVVLQREDPVAKVVEDRYYLEFYDWVTWSRIDRFVDLDDMCDWCH
ncbi:hypothetical protein MMC21_005080 [Puttea exsequens]|nr:hypothetical protein [Puttea exsequens]